MEVPMSQQALFDHPADGRPMCGCGRPAFRQGLCVTCYRHARQRHLIATTSQRPSADVVEDVEWLLDTGEDHPEMIAQRVGYTSASSLHSALDRAGRRDLISRIWTTKRDL